MGQLVALVDLLLASPHRDSVVVLVKLEEDLGKGTQPGRDPAKAS